MDKVSIQIALVVLLALGFLGLHAVDIGASALFSGGSLTNGLFQADPTLVFHAGLWLMFGTLVVSIIVGIWLAGNTRS